LLQQPKPSPWWFANASATPIAAPPGSHHVFSHPSVKDTLSVQAHRPIKAVYITRFVAVIDQMQE